MTVAEFAAEHGISPYTVRRMIAAKQLKARRFGRAIRIEVNADAMLDGLPPVKTDIGIEAKVAVAAALDAVAVAMKALELANSRLKENA